MIINFPCLSILLFFIFQCFILSGQTEVGTVQKGPADLSIRFKDYGSHDMSFRFKEFGYHDFSVGFTTQLSKADIRPSTSLNPDIKIRIKESGFSDFNIRLKEYGSADYNIRIKESGRIDYWIYGKEYDFSQKEIIILIIYFIIEASEKDNE